MKTLTKLCSSKLKNLLRVHPLSYSFEVRNCIQHIPNLARFREHIDDYIGGHCLKLSAAIQPEYQEQLGDISSSICCQIYQTIAANKKICICCLKCSQAFCKQEIIFN